jgi:hypothetical protein
MVRNQYRLINDKIYKLNDSRVLVPEPKKVYDAMQYPNDMIDISRELRSMDVRIAINTGVDSRRNGTLIDIFRTAITTMTDKNLYTLYDSYLMLINYVIVDGSMIIQDNSVKCVKLSANDCLNLLAITSTDELSYTINKILSGDVQLSIRSPKTIMRGEHPTWTLMITNITILGSDSLDDTTYGQLVDTSQDNTSFAAPSYIIDELKVNKIVMYDASTSGRSMAPISFSPNSVDTINIHVDYIFKDIFEVADPKTVESLCVVS